MITLAEVLSNISFSRMLRTVPQSRDDFGSRDSVGMFLRKKDYEKEMSDPNAYIWGLYLGDYNQHYYIGTMRTGDLFPTALSEYKTLTELKEIWELD